MLKEMLQLKKESILCQVPSISKALRNKNIKKKTQTRIKNQNQFSLHVLIQLNRIILTLRNYLCIHVPS